MKEYGLLKQAVFHTFFWFMLDYYVFSCLFYFIKVKISEIASPEYFEKIENENIGLQKQCMKL